MSMKAAVLALLGLGALVLALTLLPAGSSGTPGRPEATVLREKSEAGGGLASSRSSDAAEVTPKPAALPMAAKPVPASSSLSEGGAARDREKSMTQLAMRLAALPPDQALARIGELPDQELRDMAMLALLGEWSGMSSLELIRSGDVWRFGAGGALAAHLLESGKITGAQAVALAQQSTDGNRRGELLARVGAKLAAEDPGAAVALGNGLEGWERQRFL